MAVPGGVPVGNRPEFGSLWHQNWVHWVLRRPQIDSFPVEPGYILRGPGCSWRCSRGKSTQIGWCRMSKSDTVDPMTITNRNFPYRNGVQITRARLFLEVFSWKSHRIGWCRMSKSDTSGRVTTPSRKFFYRNRVLVTRARLFL